MTTKNARDRREHAAAAPVRADLESAETQGGAARSGVPSRVMPTSSASLALGSAPPPFALPDVTTGRDVSRDHVGAGRALLVMFLCRHCPYVKHVEAEVSRLARDYEGKLGIVGICANDAKTYPETRRRA